MSEDSNEYIYASFWRRYAAIVIDGIVSIGIFLLALLAADVTGIFDLSLFFADYMIQLQSGYIDYSKNPLLYSIWFIFLFFYYAVTMSLYGATPGKRFFSIAVISKNNHLRIGIIRSVFRFILYFISTLLLFLPFLTQLFTKKRQTLHDLMVKTIVIKGKFVNGELTETEDVFTKKWLVFLLPVGFLLTFILFVVGIPAYLGYMEAEQNQVAAMPGIIQNQPSEIAEQQAKQSQPYMNDGTKFTIIGTDKNSTNHFIDFASLKKIDNDTRQAIFKLNMLSTDGSSKIKQIINCNNFEIQTIEGQMFEQQDLMGESTFVQNISGNNVKAILGGSIDLKKYSAVCGSKLSTKLIPGFNLPDTALSVDSSTIYQKAAMARLWYTLSVPIGSKNIEDFKSYSFFAEVNCEISSIKTLLVNEFEGKSLNVYKASIDSPVAIKKVRASLNKRIPKTTELVDKAIVLSTCKVAN